jgi:hypothetical protein
METMTKFMVRRKAEIGDEIERLRAELRQIAVAERIGAAEASARGQEPHARKPETIKEQVVKILNDCPGGLDAREIQAHLKNRFARDVKRESLSPQLSRLGAEGVIRRDGKTWILPLVEAALKRLKNSYDDRNLLGDVPQEAENPQELHS